MISTSDSPWTIWSIWSDSPEADEGRYGGSVYNSLPFIDQVSHNGMIWCVGDDIDYRKHSERANYAKRHYKYWEIKIDSFGVKLSSGCIVVSVSGKHSNRSPKFKGCSVGDGGFGGYRDFDELKLVGQSILFG